jgi:hypothetical protein
MHSATILAAPSPDCPGEGRVARCSSLFASLFHAALIFRISLFGDGPNAWVREERLSHAKVLEGKELPRNVLKANS